MKLGSKSAHMKHFLLQRILLFTNLRDDFCFRIRHNSHTQPFVHPFLVLFNKLDNYGEFQSKAGLQSSSCSVVGVYKGVETSEKAVTGGQGAELLAYFHGFIWKRGGVGVVCLPATPDAPNGPLSSFSLSVVSAEWKLQALTAGQAVAVRGPYTPQRVLKPHGVTGAVPSRDESSNFMGHVTQNDSKA